MLCFARSGGTLLNRCIGCLPDVVMLSEVNPLGGGQGESGDTSCQTVTSQAKKWYGIELTQAGFCNQIKELAGKCERAGQKLVIRDWSFVNFAPFVTNQFSPPERFLILEELGLENCRPFAFVRNAIDVWTSCGSPPADEFFPMYKKYIDSLIALDIPIFKYEDFCINPTGVLQKICEYAGLTFTDSFVSKYQYFNKVNGDVQIEGGSRGIRQKAIQLLPRREIPPEKIRELLRCKEAKAVNRLLGYGVSFFETLPGRLYFEYKNIKRMIARLRGKYLP